MQGRLAARVVGQQDMSRHECRYGRRYRRAVPKVLVVDDDEAHRRVVELALTGRGFEVATAGDGRQARAAVEADIPDLILLDLGLPDIDGVDLCKHLHTWPGRPIIIVSADGDDARIVDALSVGADDYAVKPVTIEVLLARIAVQLRHASKLAPLLEETVLTVGDVMIDLSAHEVMIDGERVELRPQQFAILGVLARNADRLVTHEVLARALGAGNDEPARNAVRVNISRLRTKLGSGPNRPQLTSERHVGYRLVPPG